MLQALARDIPQKKISDLGRALGISGVLLSNYEYKYRRTRRVADMFLEMLTQWSISRKLKSDNTQLKTIFESVGLGPLFDVQVIEQREEKDNGPLKTGMLS